MAYSDYIARNKTGNMIPVEYVDEVFESAKQQSAVMGLARRLRDMSAGEAGYSVEDVLPMAYFVNGDNGNKGVTKSEWAGVTIKAEEIAAIVPIPEAVIDDSRIPLWDKIVPQLTEAIGMVVDQAVLFGTNKPSSWPKAIVKEAVDKNHFVIAPSSSPDYYELLMGDTGLISKVENDGFFVNGHLASINLRGKLRGIRDEVGQPIFTPMMQAANQYMLDGVPVTFPLNGAMSDPDVLDIAGDWNQLVYAVRKDISFKLFDQGVITDPSNSNAVVTNLMQQDMVALRIVMRLGFALPNPANRVQPTKASRYPFAVLGTSDLSY